MMDTNLDSSSLTSLQESLQCISSSIDVATSVYDISIKFPNTIAGTSSNSKLEVAHQYLQISPEPIIGTLSFSVDYTYPSTGFTDPCSSFKNTYTALTSLISEGFSNQHFNLIFSRLCHVTNCPIHDLQLVGSPTFSDPISISPTVNCVTPLAAAVPGFPIMYAAAGVAVIAIAVLMLSFYLSLPDVNVKSLKRRWMNGWNQK